MHEAVTHQMMMLRPMQAGLSGYARLQGEAGRQLVQINLRGLPDGEMRVFWYAGEGLVREVGRNCANPRGEVTLSAEIPMEAAAPRRLMALLITDGGPRPRPLAIGLCTAQSAGSLMDAKNALLALCDKLARQEEEQGQKDAANASAAKVGVGRNNRMPEQAGTAAQAGNPGRADDPSANHAVFSDTACTAASPAASDAASIPASTPPDASPADPGEASRVQSDGKKGMSGACIARTAARQWSKVAGVSREVFLPAIEARSRPERRRFRREAEKPEDETHMPAAQRPEAEDVVSPRGLPSAQETATASGQAAFHEADSQAVLHPVPSPAVPVAADCPGMAAGRGRSPAGLPADRLPNLQWPAAFQSLAAYFDNDLPLRLMNWPGWRFVHVPQGRLWVGYRQQDGRVRQVAYALPPDAQPPQGQPFRPARGADGQPVQLLVLEA